MKKSSNLHLLYRFITVLVIIAILIGFSSSAGVRAAPDVLYVIPTGGQSSGSCNSWAEACVFQYALGKAVAGNQIWVKEGTYYPTTTGDREATFQLKSGVAIYGGFAHDETDLAQRDWRLNLTILSGDIDKLHDNSDNTFTVVTGDGVNSAAILDGFTITGGNANGGVTDGNGGGMHINSGSPSLANIIFDNNTAKFRGGGMYSISSSPSLTNVSFTNNSAGYFGGAMFNYDSALNLKSVSFYKNVSGSQGGGMFSNFSNLNLTDGIFEQNSAGHGGGMFNAYSLITEVLSLTLNGSSSADLANVPAALAGDIFLTDVTFKNNSSDVEGGGLVNNYINPTLNTVRFLENSALGGDGGGIYNYYSDPKLTNVTLDGNSSNANGGGISNDYSNPVLENVIIKNNTSTFRGGGISNVTSSPNLKNVSFIGNVANTYGGGLNNRFESNATLVDVIFDGNIANGGKGGGLHNYFSDPSLTNVVFIHNSAPSPSGKGGGIHNEASSPTLVNVTFYANSATANGGGIFDFTSVLTPTISNPTVHNSIFRANLPNQIYNDPGNSAIITYSDIQGGCPAGGTCSHVISGDPHFVNPGAGDLRLNPTEPDVSPAIDAGDNSVVPVDVTTDIEGHPRFMDILDIVDTGNGVAPIVDMGAYERSQLTLTNMNLLQATDPINGPWATVPGSYTDGFTMLLNPAVIYYYLDTSTIDVNAPLQNGLFPFYVHSYPPGFFDYWAAKGVVPGAPGWQGVMWNIISGSLPIFYLKVDGSTYMLVDGFQYEYPTPGAAEEPLRINGDYQVGAYSFAGIVSDASDNPDEVIANIIFYNTPRVFDQKVSTQKDTPVDISLAPESLYPPILNWTIVSQPTKGTLSGIAPFLVYTPNPTITGTDSFTFKGNDGYADSNTGTVTIEIKPPAFGTTTTVNCGNGTPVVTYKSNITCVATVTSTIGHFTPRGSVAWTTSGSGTFTTSPCTLSGSLGTSTCSVTYTPNAVGTGSHLITATYAGDPDFTSSSGSQSVTVNKANATCPITGFTGTYDAAFHGASGSCSGIGGENAGTLDLGATYKNVPGGMAYWTFTGNGNYNNQSGDVAIVINKANATCTIIPYSVSFDGNPHTATGACLGVISETLAGLNLSGTTHTNVGIYPNDPWTFTDITGNYNNASGTITDVIFVYVTYLPSLSK